ncbi:restriction endonuclease subunit S [Corynebacterium sp. p3-SID1056]|uniref:restriction endonuclease subunit S n=1 Tax=Corynebacterium sp. p3-SID1056 TaxID=2916092 RepID=UPI0021A871E1|nr:restriction endonuclease subunit S [Corynebacterium sp. p3-SID1056]MCT2338584.1 restriction endonuclease subunit S [Corynebacterium sp. p3-SID1056]
MTQDEYRDITGHQLVKNTKSAANMKHVEPDDFIISMASHLSGLERSPVAGKVSGDYRVLRPSPLYSPDYLGHLMKSRDVIQNLSLLTTEIRVGQRISFDRFSLLDLPLPPLETQRAIADYLDRETAEIDAMSADLDEMEALLTERRNAGFSRALNRARNLGVAVPNVRVKFLCGIGTGYGDTQDATEDGEYPFYVRSNNILRSSGWDIEGPAVLTAGDGAGVGKVFHYAEGRMKVHQRVYALTNFRGVNPRYFFEAFTRIFPDTVLYGGASSTVASLRMHMLADLELPLPPLEEQLRIADEIDRETAEIDAMLADITELRDLLAERRTAVIAAAVTGQIDVPTTQETNNG